VKIIRKTIRRSVDDVGLNDLRLSQDEINSADLIEVTDPTGKTAVLKDRYGFAHQGGAHVGSR
jgi:hypothetical protein